MVLMVGAARWRRCLLMFGGGVGKKRVGVREGMVATMRPLKHSFVVMFKMLWVEFWVNVKFGIAVAVVSLLVCSSLLSSFCLRSKLPVNLFRGFTRRK